MIVHALFSLVREVLCDIEIGVLGRFNLISINFKSKGTECFVVNSFTRLKVFLDVVSQGSDDKMELSFRIKRLHSFIGARLGGLMLSWVVAFVGDDPE